MIGRYTAAEQDAISELFASGIDEVNLDVLREAVIALRLDRFRLNRLEELMKSKNHIQIEVRFSTGETLRGVLDALYGGKPCAVRAIG